MALKKISGQNGGLSRRKNSVMPEATFEGIARVAMEISRREVEQLTVIRKALDEHDDQTALTEMRKFFGM